MKDLKNAHASELVKLSNKNFVIKNKISKSHEFVWEIIRFLTKILFVQWN